MKSRETIRQARTSTPDTERGSYSPPTLEQMEPRLLLSAGLLDVDPTEPIINYNNTGTIVYDAASEALSVDATPLAIQLVSSTRPGLILTSAPSSFRIDALVDDVGDLIGGVSGDDLSVTGSVDFAEDSVPDIT